MAKLYKTSKAEAELLLDELSIAESFWARGKGLLGRKSLSPNEALWIRPCNNIHTLFMKFKIDCIFIDRNMQIKNLVRNIRPYRFVGPFWKSYSVIETTAGFIDQKKVEIGDHLYVVD